MVFHELFLVVTSAMFVSVLATCGTDMPIEPPPGSSESVTITVDDPNLGPVDRHFRIHIPAGYSDGNDVETPLVLDLHGWTGAQFNSFVEISTDFSTDFSTKFLVLQGVPHYYKNSVEKSVEKSVEISTKLLN